jgi:hypothetical protein
MLQRFAYSGAGAGFDGAAEDEFGGLATVALGGDNVTASLGMCEIGERRKRTG